MREDSPCWYYGSTFDAEETILRHGNSGAGKVPNRLTNYLGVKIPAEIHPAYLNGRLGELEGPPIPGNWHADIAEWASVLRAVELSGPTFRMVELGCGWGCWMNNSGAAARQSGKTVDLIGIEADDGHFALANRILQENGFGPREFQLFRGIAAAKSGTALFPVRGADTNWGLEPIFDNNRIEIELAKSNGQFDVLPLIGIDELSRERGRIDLLHIDIQGGEADFVEGSLDALQRSVSTMLIGTHSRQIEGKLFKMLFAEGWKLETEKAALLELNNSGPYVRMDGVQFWRNTSLLPL